MKKTCRFTPITLLLILLLTLRGVPAGCDALDPWYCDLVGHWAATYIDALWSEGVTDGWISKAGSTQRSYYYPNENSSRSQFAVLLAKVFWLTPAFPPTPSYPDVVANYQFIPGKLGYPWIEACREAGIAFTDPGLPFQPDSSLTRQDAVHYLVLALDLWAYADSMNDSEVTALLRFFRDSSAVRSDRRKSMACAVKFGIIDGYEDMTLRPANPMLRSEAATVVFRSCLIRAQASTDVFSPDGDGILDTVSFEMAYLRNKSITSWEFAIHDRWGNQVYRLLGYGSPPPSLITWDGRQNSGSPAPAGEYFYQAWVRDSRDNKYFSLDKPLTLVRHDLSASISPTRARDGDVMLIVAYPTPVPSSACARFADGSVVTLYPSDGGTRWSATKTIGTALPIGVQTVVISALFPGATREVLLSFELVRELWMEPTLSPNPAGCGQRVLLECLTSPSATGVTVEVFSQTCVLVKEAGAPNLWRGQTTVPESCPVGDYPVTFRAYGPTNSISKTIHLVVDRNPVAGYRYILTR